MRRRVLAILRVGLGLGLLALLVARIDPSEYGALLREGDHGQLVLGLALLFLAFPVLQALRLHVLVARYTESLAGSFVVFMVGAFFNTMLPSNVGGDAVRLVYLKRMRAENWGGPFAMLMLHRASGMGVLLVAAAIHAAFNGSRLGQVLAGVELDRHGLRPDGKMLAIAAAGVVLLVVAAVAIGARYRTRVAERIRRFALECWDATRALGWSAASALIALTVVFHFVRMLAFYVLVRGMGEQIALFDLLPVLAATALAGVVPLTVGGLGLMEGAISVTLALFGVATPVGIAAALANRAVLLASAALGGVVYVTSGGTRAAADPAPPG